MAEWYSVALITRKQGVNATVLGRILFAVVLAVACAPATSSQIKLEPGDLKESRRTDGFFNDLDIQLRLSGAGLKDAKAARIKVDKAIDDTGKNLVGDKTLDQEFKEIASFEIQSSEAARLEVELKNSDRRATVVKELTGVLELFLPASDPRSTIRIANFQNVIGKPLVNPTLRTAGIEVTVWTKEVFDARKRAEDERNKREIEARARKAEKSGDLSDAAEALGQGLAAVFGSMFSSFAQMDPNDLALNIKDPQSKLVAVEFEDAAGRVIEHRGKTTIGGDPKTVIFGFEHKLPAATRIKFFVLTPGSVSKVPFRLADIPLP